MQGNVELVYTAPREARLPAEEPFDSLPPLHIEVDVTRKIYSDSQYEHEVGQVALINAMQARSRALRR